MADKGAADRTEKPTPKKLNEARKQGQVPRAPDLAAWAGVLAMTFVLPGVVGAVGEQTQDLLRSLPDLASAPTAEAAVRTLTDALTAAGLALLPLLLATALVAVLAGVPQGGVRPYLSRAKPKFSKVNPFSGFKRLLGPQSLWELVKNLIKTAIVGVLAYRLLSDAAPLVLGSGSIPLGTLVGMIGTLALQLVRIVAVAALVVGVADYLVARRRIGKELRMSRKEIRDEAKQSDGDPAVKAALRRRALAMSRNRMMADIAEADVVLVNPTHVAVALRYRPGAGAPRVVAKGAGVVAARMRELATEHRVPMVEDVPLARALYKSCDIGSEIPREMFAAVAKILAFVMGLKARGAAAGMHRPRALAATAR
jgi:flagellar biosynthetic protein FlhB